MIKIFFQYVIQFIIIVLSQIFIFNGIEINVYINIYFYVLFILLLPFETPRWLLLVSAFLIGLVIDIFSQTLGVHVSATLLIAFLRPYVLNNIAPRDGYDPNSLPRIHYYGLNWFIKYTLILVIVHHFMLFYIDVFRLSGFFYTFLRVILSTLVTSLSIVVSQIFIFRR